MHTWTCIHGPCMLRGTIRYTQTYCISAFNRDLDRHSSLCWRRCRNAPPSSTRCTKRWPDLECVLPWEGGPLGSATGTFQALPTSTKPKGQQRRHVAVAAAHCTMPILFLRLPCCRISGYISRHASRSARITCRRVLRSDAHAGCAQLLLQCSRGAPLCRTFVPWTLRWPHSWSPDGVSMRGAWARRLASILHCTRAAMRVMATVSLHPHRQIWMVDRWLCAAQRSTSRAVRSTCRRVRGVAGRSVAAASRCASG